MASASTKANPLISTLPRILTWPRFGFRTICSGRLGFAPFMSVPKVSTEELRQPLPGKKEVEIFTEEFEIGSRMITLETRNIARFANGAVGLKMDGTRVLSTITGPRGDVIRDFLPLTVDYQEKQSARGVIPKTFMRREGAPTERELLCGRIIDRAIRPLFPPGFYHEMQVLASVLSSDGKQDPDVLAANATSAALMLSDIPWGGPIGVIRVGRIFGQFVVNPSMDELKLSDLNLVYACSMEKTLMIDLQAHEVPEKDLISALKVAHPEAVKYIEPQIRLASKAGKQKKEYRLYMVSEKTKEKIRNLAQAPIEAVFTDPSHEKFERGKALDKITQDVKKKLEEESDAEGLEALSKAVDTVRKEVLRKRILAEGLRVDGRQLDEVRLLECQVGILPLIHGSSVFSRGETQVVGTVTLGAPEDVQHLNSLVGPRTKRFMLHYSFPPFCTNEPGKHGGLSRREVGHGALAEKALLAVLPGEDVFPYTIRVNADVMASEGSTSMAAACAGSMALMDAGVPLKAHVGGVSVGLVTDIDPLSSEIKSYRILTDILGLEDHVGDIDFKIAGTRVGVTAMQLDMKLPGIPLDIICECLEPARKARLHILGHMENEINAPRSQDNRNSPRMVTLEYSNDAIRRIIGPLGALKKNIEEETGARISVDDGKLIIFAKSQPIMDRVIEKIELIVGREILVGEMYRGIVTSIKEYGAFVELDGGAQGLLHISELSHDPVSRVSDFISAGQQIQLMCIGQDVRGNIKLSLKAVLPVSGSKAQVSVEKSETPSKQEPSVWVVPDEVHLEQENQGSSLEGQCLGNGMKMRDLSSAKPVILIRSVAECDAEEKSDGVNLKNGCNRASKTGDKSRKLSPNTKLVQTQLDSFPTTKSSKKSETDILDTDSSKHLGTNRKRMDTKAEDVKIGVEFAAKVHESLGNGMKRRDLSSAKPVVLIRSVAECDAEEKSDGVNLKNGCNRDSKTGDKSRKLSPNTKLVQTQLDSFPTTKSSKKSETDILDTDSSKHLGTNRKCMDTKAEDVKIGVEFTAKVHQIRALGLVLDLGGGIHGMYRFETDDSQTDFVVGEELLVKCSSFSGKGIPILSLAEDKKFGG